MPLLSQKIPLALSCSDPSLTGRAAALAAHLNLPVHDPAGPPPPLLLTLTPARLELRQTGKKAEGPLSVDFCGGAVAYRRRQGSRRKEAIARAVGLKGEETVTVLDLTAGLGRDSFILASLGCTVQMVERSPVVAALLADGIERAQNDPELARVMAGISLIVGDSLEIIRTWTGERPDAIYLDPMYPQRGKSALVKKEMRLLRMLVGDDQDSKQLLAGALDLAAQRVVVKRPRLAPALPGPKADFAITGKNSRFDVYLRKA